MANSTSKCIGIDLGGNSCHVGAIVNGVLRVLPNDDGSKGFLSIFTVKKEKHVLGKAALNTASNNIIFDACRDLQLNNDCTTYSPTSCWYSEHDHKGCYKVVEEKGEQSFQTLFHQQEVIAIMLAHLKSIAERSLGVGEIKSAAISIPSFASDNYRSVVTQAAKIAGFKGIQLVNQTTAAAITYKLNNYRRKEPRTIAILAFGANTTEASVLAVSEGKITLLTTAGSNSFGGNFFTNRLTEAVLNDMLKERNQREPTKKFIKAVWSGCERAKQELSSSQRTCISIEVIDDDFSYPNFSRATFQKICKEGFDRLNAIIHQAFGPHKASIKEVLLVGGASKMCEVKQIIRSIVAQECTFVGAINPDEAVVSGAIIKAINSSTFPYAHVDEVAYNSVHVHLNGMDIRVVEAHEPCIYRPCKEASLELDHNGTPVEITISQKPAGHYGTLKLNRPVKLFLQLQGSSGQLLLLFDHPSQVIELNRPCDNLLDDGQIISCRQKLVQYKEALHNLQALEEEKKRKPVRQQNPENAGHEDFVDETPPPSPSRKEKETKKSEKERMMVEYVKGCQERLNNICTALADGRLRQKELESFKYMAEKVNPEQWQNFSGDVFLMAMQEGVKLLMLDEFLRRIEAIRSLIIDNTNCLDLTRLRSKYNALRVHQQKALDQKRLSPISHARDTLWTKQELCEEFNKFGKLVSELILTRNLTKETKLRLEESVFKFLTRLQDLEKNV